jgi:Uma2 family endonuclease
MTIVTHQPAETALDDSLDQDTGVRSYRWTVDEFFRAVKKGVFRNPERLELLDGEVIERMVQGVQHFDSVRAAAHYLPPTFGVPCEVRQQARWTLSVHDYVEPDLLFVRGSFLDYVGRDPRVDEVLLVVEVSDNTVRQDRGRKAAKYARAGVPEYWIVNLAARRLEVYQDPGPMPESQWEYGYQSAQFYSEEETVAPLLGTGQVRVADLMPRRGKA